MNTNEKYEHDLVTEDYYKKELAFQKEIDAQKNARTLKNDIMLKKTNNGLSIIFPKDKAYTEITGVISFYRPSNKKLDFQIPISLTSSELIISNNKLIEGKWNLTIDWKHRNTPYQFKESLSF